MVKIPSAKNIIRWLLIVTSFLIVLSILWNTYQFFKQFKDEERLKMSVMASAYQSFNNADLNMDVSLEEEIIHNNKNIPMIITLDNGEITQWANLNINSNTTFDKLTDEERDFLREQLELMVEENDPIVISFQLGNTTYTEKIHYRDSDLLNKLRYYPLGLLFILFLFSSIIYLAFSSMKIADQNKLWTGMAKETAHQIGTPLTSLLGWVEILRMDNVEETTVNEIEKDISRLNIIANRFSKIGSIPTLTKNDIVIETQAAFNYIKSRSFKQIDFTFNCKENKPIYVDLNLQLYGWVIENLVKNAIDAMQGKGKLNIRIVNKENTVQILITDSGKGVPKRLQKKIFKPGFTTKKRGWGLGLSLTKRIIEDYHNGKISVKKSKKDLGTTFLIELKTTNL